MESAVLIGNDINNLTTGRSWSDLLDQLIDEYSPSVIKGNDKPFPLLFDEISCVYSEGCTNWMDSSKGVTDTNYFDNILKSEIVDKFNNFACNDIHKRLLDINISHYLTTNYDYTLEKVLLGDKVDTIKNQGYIIEAKFNLFRHHRIDNKYFWHVHGENNTSKSLILGYYHYCGQVSRIYAYLNKSVKYKNGVIESPVIRLMKDENIKLLSWIDIFITHNIHIIGLNLRSVESDIWFVLVKRAKLKKKYPNIINNNIYYYSPEVVKDTDLQNTLESFGVIVEYIEKENIDYYNEVLSRVESRV